MKSFPSTLNESQNMYGSTRSQSYEATFDIERIKHGALNLNKSIPVVQEMLKQTNINISNYQRYPYMPTVSNPSTMITGTEKDADVVDINGSKELADSSINRQEAIFYENPLQLPADVIALAKDYDWVYKNRAKSVVIQL